MMTYVAFMQKQQLQKKIDERRETSLLQQYIKIKNEGNKNKQTLTLKNIQRFVLFFFVINFVKQ